MRMLCLDHGPNKMGWGVIDDDFGPAHKASGIFDYSSLDSPVDVESRIAEDVSNLIVTYQPSIVLMEEQSSFRNAKTARQMLWAQGAALVGVGFARVVELPPVEFVHRSTVQRVVGGKGGCTKKAVINGVNDRLGLSIKASEEDRADALAIGLTYPTWLAEKPIREAKRNARRSAAAAIKRAAGR